MGAPRCVRLTCLRCHCAVTMEQLHLYGRPPSPLLAPIVVRLLKESVPVRLAVRPCDLKPRFGAQHQPLAARSSLAPWSAPPLGPGRQQFFLLGSAITAQASRRVGRCAPGRFSAQRGQLPDAVVSGCGDVESREYSIIQSRASSGSSKHAGRCFRRYVSRSR